MDPLMDVIKNSEEPEWLETQIIGKLRVWQVIFLCLAGITSLIVMVCCCFRFRIPRTKQQIEADYKRRKITNKFREQLETIQDSKMDTMSLTTVIEHLRAYDARHEIIPFLWNKTDKQADYPPDALKLLHDKLHSMESDQPPVASAAASPQQSSLEASYQAEGGQKPEPQVSGLNFVKFATKVAHLAALQPRTPAPASPAPSGGRMDF